MDLEKHKKEFEKIITKYGLYTTDKAQEIGLFLTLNKGQKISAQEFALKYNMTEEEAKIFLSFIQKGIEFKEKHLNKY